MAHAINWFDIPVKNLDRAKAFYETMLGIKMIMPFPGIRYAIFPVNTKDGEIGGGLLEEEGYEPSGQGTLVYLNAGDDLIGSLARIEEAGGKIIMHKTSIGSIGFMARFLDTEGNRIALHSPK